MAALLTTAEFIANKWLSSYILDETISNAIAFNDLETLVAVLRHGAKMGHSKSNSVIARCVQLAIDHRNTDFLLRLAHSVSPIHVEQWSKIAHAASIGRQDDDDRIFEERMYLLFRARENGVFIQYICSLCPRMTSHFDQIQRTGSSVVDRGIGQAFDHIDLQGLLGLIPNYALDCILSKKFSSRQPNNEQIILDMAIEISRVMPDNFIIMNHDDNVIVSYFRTPHIRLCFVVKNVDRRDISNVGEASPSRLVSESICSGDYWTAKKIVNIFNCTFQATSCMLKSEDVWRLELVHLQAKLPLTNLTDTSNRDLITLLNAKSVDVANINYLLTTISQGNYPDMNNWGNLKQSGRYLLCHLVPLLVEMAIHETPLMQDLWRCVSGYCGPCEEDAQNREWFKTLLSPINSGEANSSKRIKKARKSCDQEN